MKFSDLMELHMMAWVADGLALWGYVIAAQLAHLLYGEASFELR